jgi:hypothetical protein
LKRAWTDLESWADRRWMGLDLGAETKNEEQDEDWEKKTAAKAKPEEDGRKKDFLA